MDGQGRHGGETVGCPAGFDLAHSCHRLAQRSEVREPRGYLSRIYKCGSWRNGTSPGVGRPQGREPSKPFTSLELETEEYQVQKVSFFPEGWGSFGPRGGNSWGPGSRWTT